VLCEELALGTDEIDRLLTQGVLEQS
jgi:hypothetical protein